MAGTVTFNAAEVAAIVQSTHGVEKGKFLVSYEDLFDPSKHKGGKILYKNEWPDKENIDPTKIGAALWLVKDRGVYLMANIPHPTGVSPVVVYAAESNPETQEFDDWWEAGKRIMGGDDCVISLPVDMFASALARGEAVVKLKVSKTKIRVL